MVSVNEIAKAAIAQLAQAGSLLTPANYEQAYEQIAAKSGLSGGAKERLAGYIARLNETHAKEAKSLMPSNDSELISFLIARLNEAHGRLIEAQKREKSDAKIKLDGLNSAGILALKALLELLVSHSDASVRAFAAKLDAKLRPNSDLVAAKNLVFANFASLQKGVEAHKADALSAGLAGDWQRDAQAFASAKEEAAQTNLLCDELAPVVAFSLTPSIASEDNTQIKDVKDELIKEPQKLKVPTSAALFMQMIKKRIELDRAEVSSSHKMLDALLGEVGKRMEKILSMATTSEEKISKICEEIAQIKADGPEMQLIKNKLLELVQSLQSEIGELRTQTIGDVAQLGELQNKVSGLQQEIDKLREETQQDFLTQLSNKRHLEEMLAAAEDAYGRYGINYAVVLFDIDHFKQINDTYGHTAGDAILAGIGSIIAQNCRKLDTAGRYGGEEFMLVLPHTDTKAAKVLAERIRAQVQGHKFIYKNQQINVRISGGVAEREGLWGKEQLVEAADKKLYAAKTAGRNQICE